jgi:adaptin ear-binding coat-associated protein 1/2
MTDWDAFGEKSKDDEPVDLPEQRLITLEEVFVYKVPPLRTAQGHRAEDWGLENPLFTGCMRIFQKDTKLRIALYAYKDTTTVGLTTDENLVAFCECPIAIEPKGDMTGFVDAVVDSSRYFVIRAQDPTSSRSTMIGVGFRERETAFDFKNTLNEYIRFVDRMNIAEELVAKRAAGGNEGDSDDGEGEEVSGEHSPRIFFACLLRASPRDDYITSSGRRSFIAH